MLRAVGPRTSISLCLLALGAVACSSGGNDATAPRAASTTTSVPGYRLDRTLRLDQIQVLGSHNSYHGRPYPQVLAAFRDGGNAGIAMTLDYAHAPLPRQFALGVRQIELDIWSDPRGGKFLRPSFPIQVGVKIPEHPEMRAPGYKVIHQAEIDTNSTCLTFVSCIRLVRTWSEAHPGHVPIDIHVEMKDDLATEPMFAALEREILSVFTRDRIVTPDDVRGDAPTLGQAVRARGWPTLGTVRGKVYFTLDNESFRAAYLSGHPSLRGRLLFTPSSPGEDDAAYAKLNDPIADAPRIKAALAAHMIVRTRADADTFAARSNDTHMQRAALNGGAQLVSTDYEQPDPTIGNGYVVRIPGGTPARCNPVTGPPGCRPTDVEDPSRLAVKTP